MEPQQIKQLRKELDWSLATFGRYFGVTAQAVLKWEKGTAQPNDFAVATMIQLKKRLDEYQGEDQKQEFKKGLKRAHISGGVVKLLSFLFNETD